MPLLGTLLFNGFVGLFTFLAKYLTQRVAVAAAITLTLTGLYVGLYVALRAILATALSQAGNIHPSFSMGLAIVVSPRSAALVASYITFWSAVELYKWKINIIHIWSRTI